ncbi:MAG: hypothetical protein KJO04_05005, partial [Bacteroidia bacterium]|nr:hypothetical protein [Bacteroidia bacterium]
MRKSLHTLPFQKFLSCLLFLILTLAPLSATSQQTDLRPLVTAGQCVSQDVQLISAELSGGACTTCTPGDVLMVDLLITVLHNTNSLRPALAVMGDLTTTDMYGNVTMSTFAECSGPIIKKGDTPNGDGVQTVNFGQFQYTCGSSLELGNILLAWTSAGAGNECPIPGPSSPHPKCGQPAGTLIINPPLQAMATAACNTGNQIDVDLTVMGGTGPFTYMWSPGGATTEDLTNALPNTMYTVTVTDTADRDGDGFPDNCMTTANITTPPALSASLAGDNLSC